MSIYGNPVMLGGSGGGGGGDVPLLTRAQWDALSTAQKRAYGLLAIQDADSGFDRGELVYGADYAVIELLQSGTARDSITVDTIVTGHYKLFVLAINSEASSYPLTTAASINGNSLTEETSEYNNYSGSGSNRRNYRMTVYDLQTVAGDSLQISLTVNNNYSSFVFGIIDSAFWNFSKALTTPDGITSGANSGLPSERSGERFETTSTRRMVSRFISSEALLI